MLEVGLAFVFGIKDWRLGMHDLVAVGAPFFFVHLEFIQLDAFFRHWLILSGFVLLPHVEGEDALSTAGGTPALLFRSARRFALQSCPAILLRKARCRRRARKTLCSSFRSGRGGRLRASARCSTPPPALSQCGLRLPPTRA